MCDRRESVTVSADPGRGRRPHRLFGFNLKTWHMALAVLMMLGTMFGSAITAGAWVGNVVLDRQWQSRMDTFHERAIPEITELVRTEVRRAVILHEVEALANYNADKLELATRLSGIEVHATDTDKRLQRIEDMVWALYQSRFGNRPPPPSPNGH